MGVASISCARTMPAGLITRTLMGSVSPAFALFRAGISSSSTSVVLPLPDTPVTAVNRLTGRSTDSACTVCSALVSRWMVPCSNSWPSGQQGRTLDMGSGADTESGAGSGAFATQALPPADAADAFGVAASPADDSAAVCVPGLADAVATAFGVAAATGGASAAPFVSPSGKYRPISERSSARSSAGVPQATTCPFPPGSPPPPGCACRDRPSPPSCRRPTGRA